MRPDFDYFDYEMLDPATPIASRRPAPRSDVCHAERKFVVRSPVVPRQASPHPSDTHGLDHCLVIPPHHRVITLEHDRLDLSMGTVIHQCRDASLTSHTVRLHTSRDKYMNPDIQSRDYIDDHSTTAIPLVFHVDPSLPPEHETANTSSRVR
ncbi:hypothetical protein [Tsukamurella soli]|uniref:Uncharacterized protein n=1 Tax=Tsukamurella soli TaxID=644556 RepID=A0ABP8KF14_9ACTN